MSLLKQLSNDVGILICGHGSRAKIAEQEFSLLASGLQARFPQLAIAYGFLEYSAPNIHMALDELVAKGVKKIYAVPGMLFAATHAQNDIPSVLHTYQQKHPGLAIEYGQELGLQDSMQQAFANRILQSMGYQQAPAAGELYDTMLVVVGRGTSVSTANAEVCKLTRLMTERLGFGWSQTVYSGVSFPSVGKGLEMALKLGYKKVVIAPYFLFGGILIDRIMAYTDTVAEKHPDVQFFKTDYLRDQQAVIDSFVHRLEQCIVGPKPQLSLMQDFQQRLANGDVHAHHHHAEFQPEAANSHEHSHDSHNNTEHSHSHEHSHDSHESHNNHGHGHSHSHAPYIHIAHPNGPRTMIGDNICCCFMRQFPESILQEEAAKLAQAPSDRIPVCKKHKKR